MSRASFAGDWLPTGGQWHAAGQARRAPSGAVPASAIVVVTDTIEWAVRPGPERVALAIVRRREPSGAPAVRALVAEAAAAASAAGQNGGNRPASAGRARAPSRSLFEL